MSKKHRILFWMLISSSFSCLAQVNSTHTHFYDSAELIYGLDNRRTHIGQQHTVIYGSYIGVAFHHTLRFKIGINGTPFERGKYIDKDGFIDRNRLVFISIGEEYDFLIRKKLRLSTYIQAGLGYNYYRTLDINGREFTRGRDTIIPIEAGIYSSYAILPWAVLKLGGGWRFVIPNVSYDLSGYYLKLGIGLHLKEVMAFMKQS